MLVVAVSRFGHKARSGAGNTTEGKKEMRRVSNSQVCVSGMDIYNKQRTNEPTVGSASCGGMIESGEK
jgi:hypothetical protein